MNIKLVEKRASRVEDLKKLSKPKLSCQSKSKYPDNNRHAGITANKNFFGQIIVIIIPTKKTRNKLEYITRCAG